MKSALKVQQDAFKAKGAISKSQRTSMIRENRREEANRTKQQEADPKPLLPVGTAYADQWTCCAIIQFSITSRHTVERGLFLTA